jgi:ribosomal protein S18 acetylase RimI-like enzyme
MNVQIIQDMDQAIRVIHKTGKWMEDKGMNPSKWWKPENLNKKFLLKFAKSNEFFVGFFEEKPACAVILQFSEDAQDWNSIDKEKHPKALYVHWLCVDRQFAGKNLPKKMIDFAKKHAESKGINLLRIDTNAKEIKLRKIYENLGFKLVGIVQEDYRKTAFYQAYIR